jgi:hypothetical protein
MFKKGRQAILQKILRKRYVGYNNEHLKIIDIRVKNRGIYLYCVFHTQFYRLYTWYVLKEIEKYFFFHEMGIKCVQFHSHEQLISKRQQT